MTKFSMPDYATSRNHGYSTKLTAAQMAGFVLGWTRLREQLGAIAQQTELMRVEPWTWSDSHYVVYDVIFILSMYEGEKKCEVKVHIDFGNRDIRTIESDPERIAKYLCEKAHQHIVAAVNHEAEVLMKKARAWEQLLERPSS